MARKLKYPARISFLSYLGDTQGCGTIRVIYPYLLLNHFKKEGLTIHTTFFSQFVDDISFYSNQTFVQFQRSATKQHFEIFQQFKNRIQPQAKVPIIYEIDDLLIGIPDWNYAQPYYKNNQSYIEKMMEMADAMVVSTQRLKEVYSKYNKKIEVIENHLPKFIWGDIYPKHEYEPREKRPRILWGGSQNHFAIKPLVEQGITGGDFGEKLLKFIRQTTDKYEWVFSGGYPTQLESVKNKIEYHGWKDIFNYPRHIKNLDIDFAMAPLMPGVFNECKSNIKQLEYVAIGCPAVYSDIEPYKKCHLRAKDDDELIAGIEKLADDIDFRARVWRKDYQSCRGQLWWEETKNIKNYINTYLGIFGQKL